MKTVGRIILIVVGIILLSVAIPSIIDSVKQINALGWGTVFSSDETRAHFAVFVSQTINALVGFAALFSGIRGKASFWLTFYSIFMIVGIVWYFVEATKRGDFTDPMTVLRAVAGFSMPIAYIIGSILVRKK
ncbi:MAG: hypothetical protein MJ239_06555 [Bacilli bacterium]|nr:hypothetical protein [Bacilli bacterium]